MILFALSSRTDVRDLAYTRSALGWNEAVRPSTVRSLAPLGTADCVYVAPVRFLQTP